MQNSEESMAGSVEFERNAKLYSPEEFQRLLLKAFDTYITGEGDIEADEPEAPVAEAAQAVANSGEAKPAQSGYGFFGVLGSVASSVASMTKNAVVKTYQARKQHLPVTKFVTSEMESIMAQKASSLTKLTNLIILFYGLYSYLTSARNSKTLTPLLNTVDKLLWKAIPFTNKTAELQAAIDRIRFNHEQILSSNESAGDVGVEPGLNEHHLSFLNTQIRKCCQNGDDNVVKADRLLFMLAFVNQIMRAHTLVSQHKGLGTLINPLGATYEDNNTTTITQDNIATLLPWRYRCNADDNMTVWTAPGHSPFVYPRMPQYGDSVIPVLPRYKLEDYLDMTVPRPYLGDTYGPFLASHDKTLVQAPAQADLSHEEVLSSGPNNN